MFLKEKRRWEGWKKTNDDEVTLVWSARQEGDVQIYIIRSHPSRKDAFAYV